MSLALALAPAPARPALDAVLRPLFERQRLPRGTARCPAPCAACVAPHAAKIERAMARREPLTFVLPSFPAKSPNPRKVLGELPDLAEALALCGLQRLCDDIGRAYAPGARIVLASDGRVFADVVGVSDAVVTRYRDGLRTMLEDLGTTSLEVFDLDDAGLSREALLDAWSDTPAAAHARARGEDLALFNGLHRFLFEDRLGLDPALSRNRLRERCAPLAVELLRRSAAWSRLIASPFPDAIRLSIHPQPPHGEKLGVTLGGEGADPWRTPWHSVVILDDAGVPSLVPRHEADAPGMTLVACGGRPSHFSRPPPQTEVA